MYNFNQVSVILVRSGFTHSANDAALQPRPMLARYVLVAQLLLLLVFKGTWVMTAHWTSPLVISGPHHFS